VSGLSDSDISPNQNSCFLFGCGRLSFKALDLDSGPMD
jgi:hypothetical protein